ncbi:MAG: hypothetical protein GEU79_10105 [Acidimicrobiia bacterium]|nr:hypothetical protein [Acidimicrobiia bacterium]
MGFHRGDVPQSGVVPTPIAPVARLRADLDLLAERVSAVGFRLPAPEQSLRVRHREDLAISLRSYLIARLGDRSAPLTVVVVGPTGSGKSTVVNSLAEKAVTESGVIRPTTRRPVVWIHTDEVDSNPVGGFVEPVVVADDKDLLQKLTIVDSPDVDSYEIDHRRIAERLVEIADIAIFVTTPQRYADATPWELLERVDERGIPLLHAMNRSGRRTEGTVSDLRSLLRRRGLEPEPILTIQEQRVRDDGTRLPPQAVAGLRKALVELGDDHKRVLESVTAGSVQDVAERTRQLAEQVEAQEAHLERLRTVASEAYLVAGEEIRQDLATGGLIREEVLERWRRRVGVGDIARLVNGSASWFRSILDRFSGASAALVNQIEREARAELASAIETRVDRASAAVSTAWAVDEAGRTLLDDSLRSADPETSMEIRQRVDDWLGSITTMIDAEGPGKFRRARVASAGVNAAAVVGLVTVFATTGGLTGAEVGVAAGAAAAQQSILENVLGRAAATSLVSRARSGLEDEVAAVLGADSARFHSILDDLAEPGATTAGLHEAATKVERSSEEFHAN